MRTRLALALLASLALSLSGLGCRVAAEPPATRRPNIVLIVADDLGYGDLGCYGQSNIRTPNLDRLAAQGVRFTQHYAGSTVCAPSRCAMMTGLHTGHTWVRGNAATRPVGQFPLRDEDVTVAELLKGAGYTTGLFGKWGLGGPESTGVPWKQGFDQFFGYLCQRHAHNYYPEFLFRNGERVPLRNKLRQPRPDGAGVAVEKIDYAHDRITDEALAFLATQQVDGQGNEGQGNDGKHDDSKRSAAPKRPPFFLCVTWTIPHANNEAGKEGMEVPELGEYAARDWPESAKRQAAMITRMDRDVGRIVERLESSGIAQDTVILFTSDNGPHREGGLDPHFHDSNGPLRGIKRALYDGGIRVPLIAYWPGTIPPAVSDHISAGWDYLPTFCDLAGVDTPASIDGISFVPVLKASAGTREQHDYLYWEFHEGKRSKQALRLGPWKVIRQGGGGIELYDVTKDLAEANDVASKHPEVVARAEAILRTARTPSARWPLE